MCNREISSRRIDWSFPRSSASPRPLLREASAKQGPIARGGGVVPTPPPLTVRVMRNALTGRGLTRALLGGGVWTPPPSGFSRIAKKRRRAAPPGFHPPYPPSLPQLLWKFRPNAMWGQVNRSGQVTQLQNNFPITPRLQYFRESYETFGIWWGHQCLQNVYLGFLISVT